MPSIMGSGNMTNEGSPGSLKEADGPWKHQRLSKDVIPEYYYLFIHPDLKESTFEGKVVIEIKVNKPTSYILLHQTNLNIITTKLSTKAGEILIESTWAYPENHYWVIKLVSELEEGSYELMLSFNGTLGSGTLGLYKSTYQNANDEKCVCMLSYFEATYARCAFPCFDEPSFKAKFAIKIAHDATGGLVALSNMCREKETLNYPVPDVNTVHFKPTPPMPPYLVALIVGEFTYTTPVITKKKVSVAVYSRPEILNSMIKARDFAAAIVDFFSDYFDFAYPLPKLDLIALPNSNIGGMENWGMITFREDVLVLNEESTCDDLQLVLNIIGHEISHMWFGDLVCIDWWDNLWLKEGFATYMAFVSGAEIFPEWHKDWVVLRSMMSALDMDAALGSHPIVQTVNSPAEIREVFDAISYEKGCCLIRMLQDLAPDGFQAGVNSYLKRYQYKSAVTQNLWDEIQKNVDFDVSFIDTWTHQMGYPVIRVDVCRVGHKFTVTQSRYLLNKHFVFDKNSSPFRYKWDVPIKYVSSDDTENVKLAWLKKDQQSVCLSTSPSVQWVKLNWHMTGFYRVEYPPEHWEIFTEFLTKNPMMFEVTDRANLIDDSFSLACSGYHTYVIPLSMIRYLQFGLEKHVSPWVICSRHFQYIAKRLMNTSIYNIFMTFIQFLLKRYITDDIWDFDDSKPFLTKKWQLEIIKLACWSEEKTTLNAVKVLFTHWLNTSEQPHHELSQIVYSYGLSGEVTQEEWEMVLERCLNERRVKEKLNLWLSLGNVKNKEYLTSLIELAKDENNLKSQDFFILLRTIVRQPAGLEVVWDFIRNEWPYLVERFTLEDMGLCGIVFNVCSQFGTEEKLKETKEFFEKYPECGAGERSRERALETIRLNIEWADTNHSTICDWLLKRQTEEFMC